MRLMGEHCLLRPWHGEDLEALVRHANNRLISYCLRDRFPFPYTREHAKEWLAYADSLEPGFEFAIEVEGEAVGGIGMLPGCDVSRYSAEVGYWLGQSHWGHGIATEALTLFTQYAFRQHGMLRLQALPFADNAASLRVLEKADYRLEGRLRWAAVKEGTPRDQLLYATLNLRWSEE
jgi:RimJ/RimL family protein N-acetyltransferase